MFDELREEASLRAVYWKDLRPGLAFAGGLTINGATPAELVGYPVLTPSLVAALHDRYRLSPEKRILVYSGEGALSPEDFSKALQSAQARLVPLNAFRGEVRRLKASQPNPEVAVWDSAWVERGTLIWPRLGAAPSLLSDLLRDVGMTEVLNREVFSRFALPADRPAAVHLVVDESYSMSVTGKDAYARGTVELFRGKLGNLLPLADVTVYAFSEECRVVTRALAGKEVRRAGTDYASFVPTVMRRLKSDRPNAVLLFTDGLPDDRNAASRAVERLSRAGVFYTQIVFNLSDDRKVCAEDGSRSLDGYLAEGEDAATRELSDDEHREREEDFKRGFGELARAAAGKQLVITVDRALCLAAVEVFDRWYGGLVN